MYGELAAHHVDLPGTLLKVNMVLCGKACPKQASHGEVAQTTLRTLRAHVPPEVPGVVFLSGGMSEQDATIRLNEMNKSTGQPWQLSFSYGRALQQSSLTAWGGDAANLAKAQGILQHRARMNGLARNGEYVSELEHSTA